MQNLRPRLLLDDLGLAIGTASARLSPSQGLRLAEQLARAAFRAALTEEAARTTPRAAPRPRRSTIRA